MTPDPAALQFLFPLPTLRSHVLALIFFSVFALCLRTSAVKIGDSYVSFCHP
jgi:hypothetical protein